MPPMLKLEASFSHARQRRTVHVGVGWLKLSLPGDECPLWLLTIHTLNLTAILAYSPIAP
jgi:hypothetical protein